MTRGPLAVPLAAALLAVALPWAARAGSGVGTAEGGRERPESPAAGQAALQALKALADEDVTRARALLAPFEPLDGAGQSIAFAGGVLRFFEQRYGEAVALIEGSGAGNAGGYLALARAAQAVTRDDTRAEGEHFAISYPKGKDEVLVPYLLEALEKQREVLAAAVGEPPPGRLTVEVVSDVAGLSRLSTLTEAEIRTSGTVAVAKFGKLMLLSPKALLKGYDWLDTAAHEYVHNVVTFRTRNRAPIWLQEGLAKWFEARWRGGGEPLSPYSAALVRDAVARDRLVTFQEMHPSLAKLPSQERAALAYAQVVLAVEFLVKEKGPGAISRVVEQVGKGKSAEEAVADAAGEPFPRFLADWKRYLALRPLPRGGDHELRKLRFRDDPKQGGAWAEWAEIGDPDARGFARLGELFRERGRWTSARLEYAKAYAKVGGRVPILAGQYALAARMSGAPGEAEQVLTEALGWNPGYPALNVQLARILVEKQDWAGARDRLLAANREDPLDPEIHAGLAQALTALGDPGGASREGRFAAILAGRPAPEGHP
ncbi:MAG TPA: tetratricopeptide repeat protein [Anaeromyxobacter sp.]|nr:tetratricopeptide repeat protein [Anaeromyxobacter sp.]